MGLGYMGILTYGMQFVDSGKTSVLVYTMPIFVTVISHFSLNEKMNVYKTMGLVCGLFGLLFIFGKEMLNIDQSALFGELCVLVAALSWGIANVFSKLQFKHIDIIHMNAWHLMMGAVMLLVFSFIFEAVPSAEWTYQAVWSLLFNGLLSTGFTFVVWFWVLNQIQASKASMALMFVPVLVPILWMAAIARTDHHQHYPRRTADMLRDFYEYIYIFTMESVNDIHFPCHLGFM